MKNGLRLALEEMDDVDFFLLEHHINIARLTRDTIKEYDVTPESMGAALNIGTDELKTVLNASYPFDLMFLSRLQAFRQSLAARHAKLKIETCAQFPDYKHSQNNSLVEKIDKLFEYIKESLGTMYLGQKKGFRKKK
jgi:hypothetical protein